MNSTLSRGLREPLLHFFLLGALLFMVDHFVSTRGENPRLIVVTAETDRQLRDIFQAARGREPNAAEMKVLRDRWVDNEVLYREGLALKVDRGDTAIRERVIFKALSVIDAGVKPPGQDDKALRQWFEAHRAKYDEPERYDFQEAVLPGRKSESDMVAFAAALNAKVPGNAAEGADLRVFTGRPMANIGESYGTPFLDALRKGPVGEWRAIASKDGLRVIRLVAITPPVRAELEKVRHVVVQDWIDATMAEQRTAAVRAMGQHYTVKVAENAR